jgi:hypothetical protein
MTVRSAIINVRVTPALKAKVEKLAAADNRTVSNMAELLLQRAIEQSERAKRDTPSRFKE